MFDYKMREVKALSYTLAIINFNYLFFLWYTQNPVVVVIMLVQALTIETYTFVNQYEWDWFGYLTNMSNVFDLIRISTGSIFLASNYIWDLEFRMLHFFHDDYYDEWNMVSIKALSFAFLILLQWLSICQTLQFIWKGMRTLLQVIFVVLNEIYASVFLIITVLCAVNDFLYFKRFIVTGKLKLMEYEILFAKHFRIFLFADFIDEVNDYDWIDYLFFAVFTLMTMLLFTNVLIAFMGDAHERVQATLNIREGYQKGELILEMETISAL